MPPVHPKSKFAHSPRHRRASGFALLVTIVLVAFLVLILVGLATFTRVETQVAANNQDISKARQNALFALNVALGKLQQQAGPDQRVTATAEILAASDVAPANRKWTGVWDSDPASPTFGQRLDWLVSSRTTPDATVAASAPETASSLSVRLVGDVSTDTGTIGNEIIVPLQDIRVSDIAGLSASADVSGHLIGRFGYWVGDEGVKARTNLSDPFADAASALTLADSLDRARLGQRVAFELMDDGTPSDALRAVLEASQPEIGRIISRHQLALVTSEASASAGLGAMSRARFHDYSLWSAGVQADVRRGGLKRDLSVAFEYDDAIFDASEFSAGATLPLAVTGTAKLAVPIFERAISETETLRGPPWHLLRNSYRLYKTRRIDDPADPVNLRAIQPNSPAPSVGQQFNVASLYSGGGSKNRDPNTNLNVSISGGAARPVTRPMEPQIAPYINRVFFAYGLRSEATGQQNSAGETIYRVLFVLTPFVVLHNPYDAPVSLRDLDGDNIAARLVFATPTFRARIHVGGSGGSSYPVSTNPVGGQLLQSFARNQAPGAFNDSAATFRVDLEPLVLAPGEVKIFSAAIDPASPNGLTYVNGNSLRLKNATEYDGGFYFTLLNGQNYEFFGSPPALPSASPTGPGGALTGPQPPSGAATVATTATEIWVAAGQTVSLELNADTTAANNYQIRYFAESAANDRTSSNLDAVSQVANLQLRSPGYTNTSALLAPVAAYTRYTGPGGVNGSGQLRGGLPVENYDGSTTLLLGHDVYVKTADEDPDRASRPFITGNPLAPALAYTALGDNSLGFPGTMPDYQMRFIDMGNGTQPLQNFLPQSPGGLNAYWGPSNTTAGFTTLRLIHIPAQPALSLGEFQHAPLTIQGYQPYFAFGNSYASSYLPLNEVNFDTRQSGRSLTLYDQSYLLNEALWDGYFLSSISPAYDPSTGRYAADLTATSAAARTLAWLDGNTSLPNRRTRLGSDSLDTLKTLLVEGTGPAAVFRQHAHRRIAAHTLTAGSFNINSRSVEAWTSILGGNRLVPMVENLAGDTRDLSGEVAFSRRLPNNLRSDADLTSASTWEGYATLDPAAIRALATAIIDEIATRQAALGRPFLSLAEFINRRLATDATGRAGALQAALDRPGGPNNPFIADDAPTNTDAQLATLWPAREPAAGVGSTASAAQSYLLQADILQKIGPFLSARSDTFVIRTYGETIDPVNSTAANPVITGRAWCEAVVQRLPAFVDQGDPALFVEPALGNATSLAAVNTANRDFGRRFQIVSFRWLGPQDL